MKVLEENREGEITHSKWQRLCYRCRAILTKFNPLDVIICARCGWIWK